LNRMLKIIVQIEPD